MATLETYGDLRPCVSRSYKELASIVSRSSLNLTVIILTKDEERHLRRCIESVRDVASDIIIIDSFSSDQTIAIAGEMGVRIYQHEFINQALQLNWAIDNVPINTLWVFRLDADEVVTPQLREQLVTNLRRVSDYVCGITVNRRIYFCGKWIRHGAIYPVKTLRLWRRGCGRSEQRWMDEHIIVGGTVHHIDADIADINLNSLTWWIDKHNRYATREAVESLAGRHRGYDRSHQRLADSLKLKRWLKLTVYERLPLGLRSVGYFCYRYVFRLGFLDGWQGLVFHVLQGFWYRFLVDVKVKLMSAEVAKGRNIGEVMKEELGFEYEP